MSGYTLQIISRADGTPCPLDEQYVVRYDPSLVVFHQSYEMGLETTPDPDKAMKFESAANAWECWRLESGYSYPQNAPLTAFTVQIRPAP